MNGPSPARPAFFFFALPLAVFLSATGLPGVTFAQESEPADDPAPSAEGQAVDEEEAEFRRRMELEEGDEGTLPDDVSLPDIVEVDPAEGPDDGLPPQSRDHIDEQLTKLIIENGRWEPEDAERPAPYTPSEAAQQDPELAAREQEAWDEQVDAYHERERAAWEQAGGQSGGSGGQGSGQGAGNGGGNGSGSGSGAGAAGGQVGEPTTGGVAGSEERPPEGEPFSALEFLGGAPAPEAEAPQAPGSADEAGPPPAAAGDGVTAPDSAEDIDIDSDSGPEPPPAADGTAGDATPGDRMEQEEPGETASGADETDGSTASGADETDGATASGADETDGATDAPPVDEAPPPGSVSTDAFEGLFEPETPAAGAGPATDEGEATSGEPPAEGAAAGSGAPPSPPSFMDWLFGLFGGDDSPEPEQDEEAGDPAQR